MRAKILIDRVLKPKQVYFETDFHLKLDIPSVVQEMIDQVWQDLLGQGKNIHQGQALRLESYSDQHLSEIKFLTSVIGYKDSVGLLRSIEYIEKNYPSLICKTLAIGGLVKTTDNKYLFIERRANSVTRGKFGMIGGMIDNLNIHSGNELLFEELREITEEIGVSKNCVEKMSLCGLVYGPNGNMIFITQTLLNINSTDVKNIFEGRLDDEAKNLIIVDHKDLVKFLDNMEGSAPVLTQMKSLRSNF